MADPVEALILDLVEWVAAAQPGRCDRRLAHLVPTPAGMGRSGGPRPGGAGQGGDRNRGRQRLACQAARASSSAGCVIEYFDIATK